MIVNPGHEEYERIRTIRVGRKGMSAWSLGREAVLERRLGISKEPDDPLLTYVGRVLTWIPADVVVIFAAAITALIDDPMDDPSTWLIVGGVILTPIAVILGAFSTQTEGWFTKRVQFR